LLWHLNDPNMGEKKIVKNWTVVSGSAPQLEPKEVFEALPGKEGILKIGGG